MELPEKTLRILHIPEPMLEFGSAQTCEHPKDGLFLYGPHEGSRSIRHISVGVIGTEQGIPYLTDWAGKLCSLVKVPPPTKTGKKSRIPLSDFPGLAATFGISINPDGFLDRRGGVWGKSGPVSVEYG